MSNTKANSQRIVGWGKPKAIHFGWLLYKLFYNRKTELRRGALGPAVHEGELDREASTQILLRKKEQQLSAYP